ncbi:zinc finger RNA-binding isoform X6 [Brachionus plicatilis]|uniref:Zinc finger RNA-binding isoform X6 n=1 Tax=Brachionus plicatilis TaxID=10195 RepID=A0A3M7PCC2_BRAPC|nr:zinc finger RNA-binding isoform X6 [Brachionus plicatilis]
MNRMCSNRNVPAAESAAAPQQQFRFNKVNTAPKIVGEQNGKRKSDNPPPTTPTLPTIQPAPTALNNTTNGEYKKFKVDESSNENWPNGQTLDFKKHLQILNDLTIFHKVKVKYDVVSESGPQHAKTFQVKCTIYKPETEAELESYVSSGSSISKAKQSAAELALRETKLEKPTAEQIKKKRSVKKHGQQKENQLHAPPLFTHFTQYEIDTYKFNKRHLYAKHAQIEADKKHVQLASTLIQALQTNLLAIPGVIRVSPLGPFAKGLMLKSDKLIQLVVTLQSHPDYSTVKDLAHKLLLTDMFSQSDKILVDTNLLQTEHCFYLTHSSDHVVQKYQLLFTSDELSDATEVSGENFVFPAQACCALNSALKRQQLVESRLKSAPNALIVLKLLRDMCDRDPDWNVDESVLELLVCVSFQRRNTHDLCVKFGEFFELVAGGVLLLSDLNLACKYLGGVDSGQVFCLNDLDGNLVELERDKSERLSRLAQQALRLIAFRKIDALLGMQEKLDQTSVCNEANPKPLMSLNLDEKMVSVTTQVFKAKFEKKRSFADKKSVDSSMHKKEIKPNSAAAAALAIANQSNKNPLASSSAASSPVAPPAPVPVPPPITNLPAPPVPPQAPANYPAYPAYPGYPDPYTYQLYAQWQAQYYQQWQWAAMSQAANGAKHSEPVNSNQPAPQPPPPPPPAL